MVAIGEKLLEAILKKCEVAQRKKWSLNYLHSIRKKKYTV